MNKKTLKNKVDACRPGDLICVEWLDASTGKSLGRGIDIDLPVKSWGIFVGLIGEKTKHIVLAQNSFHYGEGMYDLDYTAIPVTWAVDATVLIGEHIPLNVAVSLVRSFIRGGHRAFHHPATFQRRLSAHGRPD